MNSFLLSVAFHRLLGEITFYSFRRLQKLRLVDGGFIPSFAFIFLCCTTSKLELRTRQKKKKKKLLAIVIRCHVTISFIVFCFPVLQLVLKWKFKKTYFYFKASVFKKIEAVSWVLKCRSHSGTYKNMWLKYIYNVIKIKRSRPKTYSRIKYILDKKLKSIHPFPLIWEQTSPDFLLPGHFHHPLWGDLEVSRET